MINKTIHRPKIMSDAFSKNMARKSKGTIWVEGKEVPYADYIEKKHGFKPGHYESDLTEEELKKFSSG